LKPREAWFQKTARSVIFFWQRQPRNFENVTLVPHRREHFQIFLAIFLVAQLPPKEVFWYTQEFTRLLSNCARGFLGGGAKKRRTNEEE